MAKRTSRKGKRTSRRNAGADKWNRSLQIGDVVTLPSGHRIGMGKLKAAVQATVFATRDNDRGEPIYGVEWSDGKGKWRSTWIDGEEATRMRRNPRRNATFDQTYYVRVGPEDLWKQHGVPLNSAEFVMHAPPSIKTSSRMTLAEARKVAKWYLADPEFPYASLEIARYAGASPWVGQRYIAMIEEIVRRPRKKR